MYDIDKLAHNLRRSGLWPGWFLQGPLKMVSKGRKVRNSVLGKFATDTYRMGFVLHPGHAFEIVNRLERGSDGI